MAWDPRTNQTLKAQAFDFLQNLRKSPNAWLPCFELALRKERPSEIVRHACLDIVNHAIKAKNIDQAGLLEISRRSLDYVREVYTPGQEIDSIAIQNKLTQTLTYIFAATYQHLWPTFLRDILATLHSQTDGDGTVLYLKILIAVHEEIADVMVPKTTEEQVADNELKDLVRERDIQAIAASWQQILQQFRHSSDIVNLCLGCIGRWVAWTDLSLSINDALLSLLFQNLTPLEPDPRTQEVALETFVDILSKKMPGPDKLQLIDVLRVNEAVSQIVSTSALSSQRRSSQYDTDLAENVAKLVNAVLVDVVKVIEGSPRDSSLVQRAFRNLQIFLPHLLRFLSDEYDEVCATVIPGLTDMLGMMRKLVKTDAYLYEETNMMLSPLLDVIVAKMRYDNTADWGSDDAQTDEAEFQDLRKRLHLLQLAIAAINEEEYVGKIDHVVVNCFGKGHKDWREQELALHEMHLFGEYAMKHGGLYSKSKPVSPAASRLINWMSEMLKSGRSYLLNSGCMSRIY